MGAHAVSFWEPHTIEEMSLGFRMHAPESPPVSGFVPLNVVGAPTHEYDILSEMMELLARALGM